MNSTLAPPFICLAPSRMSNDGLELGQALTSVGRSLPSKMLRVDEWLKGDGPLGRIYARDLCKLTICQQRSHSGLSLPPLRGVGDIFCPILILPFAWLSDDSI